ncbi:hypothetical protein H4R34_005965 [Dimargaris verticillata]|uniref:DUF2423 domain-containing protein n=1 Tax=Dimargaris verticillata TaxID=2761393 RepID=A0A9W8AVZ1_9FUNG|nr:hypothetical protein H4R34_005965 [Dimargaris verticillata]
MAKGLRSKSQRANKRARRENLYGPAEAERVYRLAAKQDAEQATTTTAKTTEATEMETESSEATTAAATTTDVAMQEAPKESTLSKSRRSRKAKGNKKQKRKAIICKSSKLIRGIFKP